MLDPSPVETLRDLVDAYYFSKQCQPTLATLDLLAQRVVLSPLDWFLRGASPR